MNKRMVLPYEVTEQLWEALMSVWVEAFGLPQTQEEIETLEEYGLNKFNEILSEFEEAFKQEWKIEVPKDIYDELEGEGE